MSTSSGSSKAASFSSTPTSSTTLTSTSTSTSTSSSSQPAPASSLTASATNSKPNKNKNKSLEKAATPKASAASLVVTPSSSANTHVCKTPPSSSAASPRKLDGRAKVTTECETKTNAYNPRGDIDANTDPGAGEQSLPMSLVPLGVSSMSELMEGPCVLYSDIPFISRMLPVGHVAVMSSDRSRVYELRAWPFLPTRNAIWVLEGKNSLTEPILFGRPIRALPLRIPREHWAHFDAALEEERHKWRYRRHCGPRSNCHTFICDVLNNTHMRAGGGNEEPYNSVILGFNVAAAAIPLRQRPNRNIYEAVRNEVTKAMQCFLETVVGMSQHHRRMMNPTVTQFPVLNRICFFLLTSEGRDEVRNLVDAVQDKVLKLWHLSFSERFRRRHVAPLYVSDEDELAAVGIAHDDGGEASGCSDRVDNSSGNFNAPLSSSRRQYYEGVQSSTRRSQARSTRNGWDWASASKSTSTSSSTSSSSSTQAARTARGGSAAAGSPTAGPSSDGGSGGGGWYTVQPQKSFASALAHDDGYDDDDDAKMSVESKTKVSLHDHHAPPLAVMSTTAAAEKGSARRTYYHTRTKTPFGLPFPVASQTPTPTSTSTSTSISTSTQMHMTSAAMANRTSSTLSTSSTPSARAITRSFPQPQQQQALTPMHQRTQEGSVFARAEGHSRPPSSSTAPANAAASSPSATSTLTAGFLAGKKLAAGKPVVMLPRLNAPITPSNAADMHSPLKSTTSSMSSLRRQFLLTPSHHHQTVTAQEKASRSSSGRTSPRSPCTNLELAMRITTPLSASTSLSSSSFSSSTSGKHANARDGRASPTSSKKGTPRHTGSSSSSSSSSSSIANSQARGMSFPLGLSALPSTLTPWVESGVRTFASAASEVLNWGFTSLFQSSTVSTSP